MWAGTRASLFAQLLIRHILSGGNKVIFVNGPINLCVEFLHLCFLSFVQGLNFLIAITGQDVEKNCARSEILHETYRNDYPQLLVKRLA